MANLEFLVPKGAPAGSYTNILKVAQAIARMVYSVANSTSTDHSLNANTALIRITALSQGLYVAFTSSADKDFATAQGTLTSDTTNVADGATVTIGSVTYRFKDTMAQAYDVKIGADAATSLDNLKAAINASGTEGVEYYAGTLIHPTVTATTNTDTTQVVVAKTTGASGNSIATTETSTHLSWGGTTLSGGDDANFDAYVAVGDTLEIGRHEDMDTLSMIGDGGTATALVIEF